MDVRHVAIIPVMALLMISLSITLIFARQNGEPFTVRYDVTKFRESKSSHGGAGSLLLQCLLDDKLFDTNMFFLYVGRIGPKSGIGEHIHRHTEEMFFILNAPAQFTVNGHTALLPAGSCVLCPKGSSHGIYNPNPEVTLEWMNLAVTEVKGVYDVINFGDSLTTQTVESPAPFKWAQLDRSLLAPINMNSGQGEVLCRRLWGFESFATNWHSIIHMVIPTGTSVGYHRHNTLEESYYILSGSGMITVNDKTWVVDKGDAIPCTLGDSHGIYNNTGEDLELFVMQVSSGKEGPNEVDWGDDLTKRIK